MGNSMNPVTSITLTRRKRYSCSFCSFKTFYKNNLISHSHTCRASDLQCPKCDFLANDSDDLCRHQSYFHSRQYYCVYCPLKADQQSDIDDHIIKHHGTINTYKCKECSFSCLNKDEMDSHTIDHELETPYPCQFCPKSYHIKSSLYKHYRRCHGSVKNYRSFIFPNCKDIPIMSPPNEKEIKPNQRQNPKFKNGIDPKRGLFLCKQCGYSTFKKCHFVRHVRGVHKSEDFLDFIY